MNKLWLVIITFLLFSSQPAQADHGTLGHWGVRTVVVADLTGDVEWGTAIRQAMDSWNEGLDYIDLVPGIVPNCNLVIERTISICITKDLPYNWLGDARHTYKEDHIIHVQIALRQQVGLKQIVACHEIGHALGVWHRSQDSESCLAPIVNTKTSKYPDDHDFREVNKLHSHRDEKPFEL